jgi:hypothetical protein
MVSTSSSLVCELCRLARAIVDREKIAVQIADPLEAVREGE